MFKAIDFKTVTETILYILSGFILFGVIGYQSAGEPQHIVFAIIPPVVFGALAYVHIAKKVPAPRRYLAFGFMIALTIACLLYFSPVIGAAAMQFFVNVSNIF